MAALMIAERGSNGVSRGCKAHQLSEALSVALDSAKDGSDGIVSDKERDVDASEHRCHRRWQSPRTHRVVAPDKVGVGEDAGVAEHQRVDGAVVMVVVVDRGAVCVEGQQVRQLPVRPWPARGDRLDVRKGQQVRRAP